MHGGSPDHVVVGFRCMFVTMVVLGGCLAQEPDRPVCNAQNRGRLWPEGSTRDTCRAVEICGRSGGKYRWEPVTVHVSQLAKDPKRRPACEASPRSSLGTLPSTRN